ncbi:hypothetical protein [Thermoleptolyngbya sp. C42_A2020_037]|uniref:hypothetical protein n=1 Tax=Thermoleptolyngbya sp. C42_A2020_037 TaxID=2747799 RepID=UPI001A100855|nr:hypothetical protein [Thermoleptolyngbya sp. C42_A2020_037]MBF2084202.1 hypothetical protein [Thermoleptolyngbya sp. C42_A2020_037]
MNPAYPSAIVRPASSLLRPYYTQITLTSSGARKTQTSLQAKAFLQAHCLDSGSSLSSHKQIQQQLITLWQTGSETERAIAEICLRCYISHQIVQVCIELASRFGLRGGFQLSDLLPLVLDDAPIAWNPNGSLQPATELDSLVYRAFAYDILGSFDPSRNTCLSTWTKRKVFYHRELNAFLQERGIYLISDWALLNSATTGQIRRTLASRYALTEVEIQQACQLLESYHAVYSEQLRQVRSQGYRGKCPTPTTQQLQDIAQHLQKTTGQRCFPLQVMAQLSNLAQKLRQRQPSTEPLESVDVPAAALDEAEQNQSAFLQRYRKELVTVLDRAIAQVVCDRLQDLQGQRGQRDRQFLKALHLFYAQGRSMGEIAPLVGMGGQPQVSRLLKLRELRIHICQQIKERLKIQLHNLVMEYAQERSVNFINSQLDSILDVEIDRLMTADSAEASTANRSSQGLLAQRFRRYLERTMTTELAA